MGRSWCEVRVDVDVDVYAAYRTNTCGGSDRVARTDAKGSAQITIDPSFTGIDLTVGGPFSAGDPKAEENSRELSLEELRELFSKHTLTVRW